MVILKDQSAILPGVKMEILSSLFFFSFFFKLWTWCRGKLGTKIVKIWLPTFP